LACDINSRKRAEWPRSEYPESQIYDQFIDNTDRLLSEAFIETENIEKRVEIINQMNDPRLIDFAKRIVAMEHSDCDPKIMMNFQEFESKRLLTDDEVPWRTLTDARKSLEAEEKKSNANNTILKATRDYYNLIEKEIRK
jgi:exonuclease I